MKKIKSIEKGWGDSSTFFSTSSKLIGSPYFVHEIAEERKGITGDNWLLVYRGYEGPGHKMKFEIEAGSGVTLTFENES